MLVLLGGFLGSGRKTVVQRLVEHGFFYCNVIEYKLRRGEFGASGVTERLLHPSSEIELNQIYDRILRDFPMLSKMHENVVFEDSFVREKPREYFFKEAKRYFKSIRFFWIDCSEEVAEARLERMVELKMVGSLAEAKHYRAQAKKRFQPFTEQPTTFVCDSPEAIEYAASVILAS